jgi:NADP-dependent 3-hydroxy acid dehydrogenase YdfG
MCKIWFVTGATRGLGRAWVEAALKRGDKIAATARKAEDLADLKSTYGDAFLPLVIDLTNREAVSGAVASAVAKFGRIDVVVSNAGYALFGTIEESDEADSRAQFDVNFFGTLWVIQAVLPQLRKQGGGHILVTSSVAGIITFPTAGVYNATKWAVEGLTETLASEVDTFGIKVTLIEPGGYATDWRGSSATRAEPMPEYDALRDRMKVRTVGHTLGDPAATAQAILTVVDAPEPPLRLFLGNVGFTVAKQAYASRIATWEAWASLSADAQGQPS